MKEIEEIEESSVWLHSIQTKFCCQFLPTTSFGRKTYSTYSYEYSLFHYLVQCPPNSYADLPIHLCHARGYENSENHGGHMDCHWRNSGYQVCMKQKKTFWYMAYWLRIWDIGIGIEWMTLIQNRNCFRIDLSSSSWSQTSVYDQEDRLFQNLCRDDYTINQNIHHSWNLDLSMTDLMGILIS